MPTIDASICTGIGKTDPLPSGRAATMADGSMLACPCAIVCWCTIACGGGIIMGIGYPPICCCWIGMATTVGCAVPTGTATCAG